jgi:hypothetical protein
VKANDLIAVLSDLVAQHGDLDVMLESDLVLAVRSVRILGAPHFDPPVIALSSEDAGWTSASA